MDVGVEVLVGKGVDVVVRIGGGVGVRGGMGVDVGVRVGRGGGVASKALTTPKQQAAKAQARAIFW
jgi:hypothetical protein